MWLKSLHIWQIWENWLDLGPIKKGFGQNLDYSHQFWSLQYKNCTTIIHAGDGLFVCSTQKTSLMGATKKPLDTYWGLKACVTCKTAPFMRKVQMQWSCGVHQSVEHLYFFAMEFLWESGRRLLYDIWLDMLIWTLLVFFSWLFKAVDVIFASGNYT